MTLTINVHPETKHRLRSEAGARIIAVILASICFVGGCDIARGVTRSAELHSSPSAAIIESAIRAAPGVREVDYREIPPQTYSSLYKGTFTEPGYPQFYCHGDSANVTVEVKDSHETGKRLYVYCIWLNYVPSDMELSDTRELVIRIYETLHERVTDVPPLAASKESFLNLPRH